MKYFDRSLYLFRGLFNLARAFLFEGHPFILSHLITSKCNCTCPICIWRSWSSDELSTAEIVKIYEDARRTGFAAVAIWGGEPLLRNDLAEIVLAARKLKLVTIVVTNGFLLPELSSELVPQLDALIVSLDFPSTKHDEFRGCSGLFERAIKGIEKARKVNSKLKLSINCTLTRANLEDIEPMIRLSELLGVSIAFSVPNICFDEGNIEYQKYRLAKADLKLAFKKIKRYKLSGYRVNNSRAYIDWFIRGNGIYRCRTLDTVMTIQPDGKVKVCLSRKPIADLRETTIAKVLQMESYKRYQRLSHECNRCMDYGTVECAHLLSLEPRAIIGMAQAFLS